MAWGYSPAAAGDSPMDMDEGDIMPLELADEEERGGGGGGGGGGEGGVGAAGEVKEAKKRGNQIKKSGRRKNGAGDKDKKKKPWTVEFSKSKQRWYYFNSRTRERLWKPPPVPGWIIKSGSGAYVCVRLRAQLRVCSWVCMCIFVSMCV